MNESDKDNHAPIHDFLKQAFDPAFKEAKEFLQTHPASNISPANTNPVSPTLFAEPHWLVTGAKGFIEFFAALEYLVPIGSVLQIEGNPDPDVEEGLRLWLRDSPKMVGQFWQTPAKYIVPITIDNMTALAKLADKHAEPEVADHFLVLHGNELLLHWYDAPSDPIYISCILEEANTAHFSERLNAQMKKMDGD